MARKLIVEIIGDASSLDRALGKSTKQTKTFSTGLASMGKVAAYSAGAAGVGLLVSVLGDSVTQAMDAEKAHKFVEQAFKNAGLSAEKYAKQIGVVGDAAVKLGFDDEEAQKSLAKFVVAGESVGKGMKDVAVAEDLARQKGIDLTSATQILTGALAGNQRAVKQLGIVIPPVTSHVDALKKAHEGIKGPIDAAALAHAKYLDKLSTGQAIIETLSGKVRGQGQAYAETAAGGMERFRQQMDNLEENIGSKLLPILTSVVNFINTNWSTIGTVIGDVWNTAKIPLESFIAPMRVLWDLLHGDWSGAWDALKAPAVAAFEAVKGAIQPLIDLISGPLTASMSAIGTAAGTAWAAVSGAVTTSLTAVKTAVDTVWTPVADGIKTSMKTVQTVAETVWAALSGAVKTAFNVAKTAFETLWNVWFGTLKTELNWVAGAGSAVWAALSGAARVAFGAVKTAVDGAWSAALGTLKSGLNWIKDNAGKAWDAFKTAVQAVVGPVVSAVNAMIGPVQTLIGWVKSAIGFIGELISAHDKIPKGGGGGGGGFGGKASGGYLPGAASQGIPILAHGGEYVIRKSAVDKLGVGFLNSLNRYDDGGEVPPIIPKGSSFDTPANRAAAAATHDWGTDNVPGSIINDALRGRYGRRAQVQAMERAKIVDGVNLPAIPSFVGASRSFAEAERWGPFLTRVGMTLEEGNDTQVGWQRELARLSKIEPIMPLATGSATRLMHLTDGAIHGEAAAAGKRFLFTGSSLADLLSGVPALASGGRLMSDGLYYGHRGETVQPASVSRGTPIVNVYVGEKQVAAIVRDAIAEDGRRGGMYPARMPS